MARRPSNPGTVHFIDFNSYADGLAVKPASLLDNEHTAPGSSQPGPSPWTSHNQKQSKEISKIQTWLEGLRIPEPLAMEYASRFAKNVRLFSALGGEITRWRLFYFFTISLDFLSFQRRMEESIITYLAGYFYSISNQLLLLFVFCAQKNENNFDVFATGVRWHAFACGGSPYGKKGYACNYSLSPRSEFLYNLYIF